MGDVPLASDECTIVVLFWRYPNHPGQDLRGLAICVSENIVGATILVFQSKYTS